MSTFSTQTSSSRTTQKGFSEEDVQLFLKKGATLASRRTGAPALAAPGEKERVTTKFKRTTGAGAEFFGAGGDVRRKGETGFMGKFATMNKAQLESLAATFKQREQSIAQRRAQPGRASLFMARS